MLSLLSSFENVVYTPHIDVLCFDFFPQRPNLWSSVLPFKQPMTDYVYLKNFKSRAIFVSSDSH